MDDNSKNEILKKTRLFSSLDSESIDSISSRMVVKQFRKNETILYEADTNKFMYLILSGKVKVVRTTEDGKEIILAMHQSGNFFGEMSLIDGKTTPASVIATSDSLISIISQSDFFAILYSQNKVVENLLKILCTRLRQSWDTIQLLNFNNASHRTKMLLLMLCEEYGEKTPAGIVLKVKLTHQDISDMTGLTRETVTRVLDKLQKSKEISIVENKAIRLSPDFMRDDFDIRT